MRCQQGRRRKREGRIKEGKGGIEPYGEVGTGCRGDGGRSGGWTQKKKVEVGGFFSCSLRKAVESNWFLM